MRRFFIHRFVSPDNALIDCLFCRRRYLYKHHVFQKAQAQQFCVEEQLKK